MFSASEQDTEHQAIAPVYMSVQSSNGHWGEQVPMDDLKISPALVFSIYKQERELGRRIVLRERSHAIHQNGEQKGRETRIRLENC